MKKLILLDSNSLLNRAFYALPPLENKKGVVTNAVYGYLTDLVQKYGRDTQRFFDEPNSLAAHFVDYLEKMSAYYEDKPESEAAFDYVAGMTDDYAIDCVSEIMLPKSFQIKF